MFLGEPSTDLVGARSPLREIVYNVACKNLFELFFVLEIGLVLRNTENWQMQNHLLFSFARKVLLWGEV